MNVASVVEDDLTSLAKLYLCRMKELALTEAVVLYFWGREIIIIVVSNKLMRAKFHAKNITKLMFGASALHPPSDNGLDCIQNIFSCLIRSL